MKNSDYPKISIITPVYNSVQYIEDCIQSVALQEYPKVEHIIIDGGSTDGTVDVIKKFPHLRWISELDEGQSQAINKGFRFASGDLMAWLNGDDYYLPGAFRVVAQSYLDKPEADLYYGERTIVSGDKHILKTQRDHRFDFGILLYDYCYISSTSTFIRRRIIDEGNFLNEKFKVTMDLEFYVRLSKRGYLFEHIQQPLAAFRMHGNNVSENLVARRREERLWVQFQYGTAIFRNRRLQEFVFDLLRPLYKLKRLFLKHLL